MAEERVHGSILVVEDDATTADLVALYLRHAGYRVSVESSGRRALDRIRSEAFDVLVLDVMLPDVDGLTLCREARARGDARVIMLTARTREQERIAGLDLGADDYVCKPFSPRELVARVAAVLRRASVDDGRLLVHGALRLDRDRHAVELAGKAISLTPGEFALLEFLMERPGFARTRTQLLERLPGDASDRLDRTVDVHVRNLRRKIEDDASAPRWIETVTGVGYRLAALPPEGA